MVVYLDHAATTPLRPDVLAEMMPLLTATFANPSGSHRLARQARQVVDEAREMVADASGWKPGEVVFTSGGTEADNTIVTGAGAGGVAAGPTVCPATEHHAVLHPMEARGATVVRVDAAGAVDLDALEAVLHEDVVLVSTMAVNNEVGTITDLARVSEIVRRRAPRAVLHTDAVQAGHWLDLAEMATHVDAVSIAAHKIGGPKGVGALLVSERVNFRPLILGGGQERDRRSGTHNVAGIVGLAHALRLAQAERIDENRRIAALRDRLVDTLVARLDGVVETVDRSRKIAGSAHLLVDGVESESLLFLLDRAGICASAASACASGAMEPSHVLAAMGVDPQRAAIRLTLGALSDPAGIDQALDVLVESIETLRRRTRSAVEVGS